MISEYYTTDVFDNPFSDPMCYSEKVRNLACLCRFVIRQWECSATSYMIIPKHLLSDDSVEFLSNLFYSEHYEFYKGPGLSFGHAPYLYHENDRYLTFAHQTGLDV